MAHPFQHLKDHKVQKSRVASIARASGGRVGSSDCADESPKGTAKAKVLKQVLAEGGKSKQRADKKGRKRANGGIVATSPSDRKTAPMPTIKSDTKTPPMSADTSASDFLKGKVARKRGGRVKKNAKTIVNVNVTPPVTPPLAPPMPPPPGAMPIGGPGAMAAKPPMAPPPGPPPGGPPMPGPGPMPMRKAGGRVEKAEGGPIYPSYEDRVKAGEDGRGSNVRRPLTPKEQADILKPMKIGKASGGKVHDYGKTIGTGPSSRPTTPHPDSTAGRRAARASGGGVNTGTKVFNKSRAETPVTHTKAKNDTDDMKRPHMKMKPKVVTFATGGGVVKSFRAYGGAVEAPGPGKGMGPKTGGGAEGGEARLDMAKRAKRS